MDRQRALELARKLAAIDNRNATEAEAVLAAEHLARIAAQHGFTKLDFTEQQVKSSIKDEKTSHGFTKRPKWIDMLVGRVCHAFKIQCIWIGGTDLVDFVGDETDVALAKYFVDIMVVQLPKIRWKAREAANLAGKGQVPTWKESWERGFVDAIGQRLDEIGKHWADHLTMTQHQKNHALIIASTTAIKDYIAAKYPNLVKGRAIRFRGLDRDAFARGQSDGRAAHLNHNIKA